MNRTALVWFRLDLRLSDNPALNAACESGYRILPVFIWAPEEEGGWPPGAASRWWLHRSLQSLDAALRKCGSALTVRRGPTLEALRNIVDQCGAKAVFWNWRVEPALRLRDAGIFEALQSDGIHVETSNASLLYDPESIKNKTGKPYRVFTPFWKTCAPAEPHVTKNPPSIIWESNLPESIELNSLGLEPSIDWAEGLRNSWKPGEEGAWSLFEGFMDRALEHYIENRDFPSMEGTSRLSPHLHFGEISPHRIRAECLKRPGRSSYAFIRQLAWREFAHHLLFHFPETTKKPLYPKYGRFPWIRNKKGLENWQRGLTGFPIVDAGMRQLWATGWMHNRARMIAGSFLVKDLMITWLEGARWFWDTLVDADLANNTLGWQWVAGCGADAAPYIRIFNPTSQSAKFDPDKNYIRQWIPELETSLYPAPIVEHARARERALAAYKSIQER